MDDKRKREHNQDKADTGQMRSEMNEVNELEVIEKLRRELEEEKNRHLRTIADFDNFRKRISRDADSARLNAKKDILIDLLAFLDYFDQARKQVQDAAAKQGIEIMARQLNELLYKHGVRPVECMGLPFDPEEQQGLGYVETDQCPEGCVAEEICSGYKLGDILLKPAQVMVARAPEEE
ncbi:MAG: nucleotide exchange factor GrpE [Bacillota bacterium]|nr:nucleotide exchange factor GrpE [Bacillota bacterium]